MSKRSRQQQREGGVQVRMLVDHREGGELYPGNSCPTFDADTAAALVGAGVADDNPAAIAAGCESAEHVAWAKKKASEEGDE